MIRNIELKVSHGAVEEAPKTFQIDFLFSFRKAPITIWLNGEMSSVEIMQELFSFIQRVHSEIASR